MKRKTFAPGVQKAVDYIRSGVSAGEWPHGTKMPSIRRLARMAGVSLVTMFKAIQLLKKNGVIAGSYHHRIASGPIPGDQIESVEKFRRWQQVRHLFEKDILAGKFGVRGKIPLSKELESQYDCSPGTMRKILASLASEGILASGGRGYTLAETGSNSAYRKILFITTTGHYSQVSALNSEHNRIVNLFENACVRLGIGLEILEIDFFNPVEARKAAARAIQRDEHEGYIVDLWWYTVDPMQQSYLDLIHLLSSFKKPIAILDEIGTFALPMPYRSNPFMQVYACEGQRAGRRIARMLLAQGHQSIAFISVMPNEEWSKSRYAGLLNAYARAGKAKGVHLVADYIEVVFPCMLTEMGMDDSDVRRVIAAGRTPDQAKDLERLWMDSRKKGTMDAMKAISKDSILKNNVDKLSGLISLGFTDPFFNELCIKAVQEMGKRMFGITLQSFFEKALSFSYITAWVCASDAIAFEAMQFLREWKIKVPSQISVVGFDNVPPAALEQGLTTFDFNAPGFVTQMLYFILHPRRPKGQYHHQTIEVEGTIIERESTGRSRT